jgi:DnaK suppressor protein
MDSQKLEYFRKLLTETLESLLQEASKTVQDMAGQEQSLADPTDRATVESDREFFLRMRDREHKLMVKIREALSRIEDGTYGVCEECEEEISEQRLMARPVTTLCIECKTYQEEDERRRGDNRVAVNPTHHWITGAT